MNKQNQQEYQSLISNLMFTRSFAKNCTEFESDTIVQRLVGQLLWGHNVVLLNTLKHEKKYLPIASRSFDLLFKDLSIFQAINSFNQQQASSGEMGKRFNHVHIPQFLQNKRSVRTLDRVNIIKEEELTESIVSLFFRQTTPNPPKMNRMLNNEK